MTGKVVLSLMDEDPGNGFVRIMACLVSFDPENNRFYSTIDTSFAR